MLREEIPTVKFTAKECHEKTADVVTKFLRLLGNKGRSHFKSQSFPDLLLLLFGVGIY